MLEPQKSLENSYQNRYNDNFKDNFKDNFNKNFNKNFDNNFNIDKEKEIISLLLSNGISIEKSKIITEKLYYKFYNLYNIVNASEKELMKIKGIGEKKIEILKNLPKILEYYLLSGLKLSASHFKKKDLTDYLIIKLGKLKFETFSIICLDINKRFISMEQIFRGTIDSATIYPRDLVEKSLSVGASYVIISHNHPSGISKPSKEDIEITKVLYKAFLIVNIKMIDHIIIAGNSAYSFRESGILDNMN